MTDDRLDRALSEAIEELAATRTPDYLDDILERTSRTRQRPRWTFPARYTMSPTLRFATVGAVALAIGLGVSPVLQALLGETEDTSPAATVAEPVEPLEFQARWTYGNGVQLPEYSVTIEANGWRRVRDLGWKLGIADAGDPRLDGRLTVASSSAQHRDGLEIHNGAFRIENDGGTWQQRPSIQSVKLSAESQPMTWTAVFDGDGEYEGLAAIAGITRVDAGWDVEGVIVEAALLPGPPSTLDLD